MAMVPVYKQYRKSKWSFIVQFTTIGKSVELEQYPNKSDQLPKMKYMSGPLSSMLIVSAFCYSLHF